MAETNNGSLQQNPTHQSLFHALDPVSLILSQTTSNSDTPLPLTLITSDSFYTMERGPRYTEYAELRESKLRRKREEQEESLHKFVKQTAPKKQVKFQTNLSGSKKGSSALYQSVPDFSATLRKENRKPRQELTPPMASSKNLPRTNSSNNGFLSSSCRGSKSANAGEKRNGGNGGILARKSYANVEELRGLSMVAATAINGESRRGGRGVGKTILGVRQF